MRACHDGSAFVDVPCAHCGALNHVHESQIAGADSGYDIGARCHSCGVIFVLPRDVVEREFAASRARMADDAA